MADLISTVRAHVGENDVYHANAGVVGSMGNYCPRPPGATRGKST